MGKMCENVKDGKTLLATLEIPYCLSPSLPFSALAQLPCYCLLPAAFCRVGAFCWPRKQLEVVQA